MDELIRYAVRFRVEPVSAFARSEFAIESAADYTRVGDHDFETIQWARSHNEALGMSRVRFNGEFSEDFTAFNWIAFRATREAGAEIDVD